MKPMRMPKRVDHRCAVLPLIAGLGLALSAAHADPQPSAAARVDATDADAARRAEVVASFDAGKSRVTVGDVEDAIRERNPFMQARYATVAAVRSVLEEQLRFELLAAEAERRGFAADPDSVLAQRQAAVQALIKHEFDDTLRAEQIPTSELRQYYDSHKPELVRGEGRRASLLLLHDDVTAQALLPRAKSGDVRAFRELVRSESLDLTNKQRGGDLSYFDAQGRLFDDEVGTSSVEPAIARAAFALKDVGDTSDVFPIGQNRGILRLTGIRPAQDEGFEKAEERLRMRLWRERRQASIDAHVAALKQSLNVHVHPELMDVVQLDTGPALPPSAGLPSGFPHIKAESKPPEQHTGAEPR